MDYWFTEVLITGETTFPTGVRIQSSDPASQPRAFFVLENDTQTPLYVMSLEYKDVLVMTTPDPYWKNRVNGAHEAASYTVVPGRQANLGIEALIDLDKDLKDYNVLSTDPPPQNVQIPSPQSSELLLVYGEQVIEAPFTLSYSLNTHFGDGSPASVTETAQISKGSPTSPPNGPAGEQASRETFLAVGLAGTGLLALTVWLVWRGLNRRS